MENQMEKNMEKSNGNWGNIGFDGYIGVIWG